MALKIPNCQKTTLYADSEHQPTLPLLIQNGGIMLAAKQQAWHSSAQNF